VKEVDYTDYILLNGGTNDAVAGIYNKIGTVTEDFDSKRDISTFCGAFEEIIATLKEKYPNAAIVYVRVHCMDRRDYKRQLVVGEEAVKICEKWGVGTANVFEDSGFNTYLDRYRAYTFKTKKHPDGDMVHPTLEGYKLFYIPYIEEAYKGLVLKDNKK
jgi:hypothetical protein